VIRIKTPSKEKKKRSDFLNHKVEKCDLLLSDDIFFLVCLYENRRGKNGVNE
jgi:hypothetical protein